MAITGSQKAYRYALSNVARSGATRSGYVSGHVFISIGGVAYRHAILIDSLTITDELDETANRCRFRIIGGSTLPGKSVRVTLGSTNGAALFAGHVVDTSFSYWQRTDRPANYFCDVSCLDYTWQLGFVKVTKKYTNQSATAIAQDLIATYAAVNGFTATAVQPNLPALDEITFTNEDFTDALTRLARRIGAYWYVDSARDVHLFYDEPQIPPPADLTPTHPTLSHVVKTMDRSQTLTRVYVEGRGTTVLAPVAPGDTSIPVKAVDMFAVAPDVFLKVSFQGADGGAQHLNFSGVVEGRGGTIVGPGIGPASAVTLTAQTGAGVTSGYHAYVVTFATAVGESLQSPAASVTTGEVPDPIPTPGTPTTTATHDYHGLAQFPIGRTLSFKYAYSTVAILADFSNTAAVLAAQTLPSPVSASIVTIDNKDPLNPGKAAVVYVPIPYAPDPRVKSIVVYARDPVVTGANWCQTGNVYLNWTPGTTSNVRVQAVSSGTNAPTANTTGTNQINVTAIPVGSASVTARKIYRTAAGGGPPRLLATIANNTTTTYLDTLADAALGVEAPALDTSGLAQPAGSVLPGAQTLPLAGTSAFLATGGWAIVGNGEQVIRYTGITASGSTLVGIPVSGVGAITAAVNYNSTVTAAPLITGIPASGPRSLTRALTAGDELYFVVQADDAARQTLLAADMGGNGIREEWDQDRRLSIPEARARAAALLALREFDRHGLSYTCRDLRTAAGRTIFCNLPTISVYYFRIQRVTISNFRPYPTQYPTFTVEASSSRFSFEDLLRMSKPRE